MIQNSYIFPSFHGGKQLWLYDILYMHKAYSFYVHKFKYTAAKEPKIVQVHKKGNNSLFLYGFCSPWLIY